MDRYFDYDEPPIGVSEEAIEWAKNAWVELSGTTFNEAVHFDGFIFPGRVIFNEVTFEGWASASHACFHGPATFSRVNLRNGMYFSDAAFRSGISVSLSTCNGPLRFRNARISKFFSLGATDVSGEMDFHGARFADDAEFLAATVKGAASFECCSFMGHTNFRHVELLDDCSFYGSTFQKSVNFDGTFFSQIPDINQVLFSVPPRLDNIRLAMDEALGMNSLIAALEDGSLSRLRGGGRAALREISARCRALQRIAEMSCDDRSASKFSKLAGMADNLDGELDP